MTTKTIIVTRRLRLRTWRRSDWREYGARCNLPEVMHHLGGVMTQRQVRREVEWHVRHQQRHGFSFWVIERKHDNALLGFCGLIRVGEAASPIRGRLEIGWRLAKEMWHRGYGLEAASAVSRWSERYCTGQEVYARISVENASSIRLARRLGMCHRPDLDHIHPLDGMRLTVFAAVVPAPAQLR